MEGNQSMIYPDISLEEWLKKYPDLKVYERECPKCKAMVRTNRPFISEDYVGIELEFCPNCNIKVGICVANPRTKQKLREWQACF